MKTDLPLADVSAEGPAPLLTYRQVAKLLAVSERTIFTLAKRGDLPGVKIGGQVRFDPRDLESFIERQKQSA